MNIEELLSEGPVDGMHIALVAAAAAFFAVLAMWRAMLERTPVQRRIGALSERREALKQDLTTSKRRAPQISRSVGLAKRTVEKLKLMRGQTAALAAKKLVRAGYRSNDAVAVYLFAKLCLPLGCGAAAVIGFYSLDLMSLNPQMKLVAAIGAVLVGFYLPEVFVKNVTDKRREKLVKALPDMLDLMVICTEAGSSLDATLTRVSYEIRPSSAEMAEEVELTGIELGFLPDRRMAFENFCERTGLKHIDALVSTLMQTEKYGTPLAQSLRILARELRDERLMAAEAKAARLPATLMIPMVIFILPVLFIVLIGPGALSIVDGLGAL
ncbi:MAG: type II secretion system F family protein [Alphaproteobacteria bacterium]|nr:type II secretion system F family protein [Alphaproteobacteria bacterium]